MAPGLVKWLKRCLFAPIILAVVVSAPHPARSAVVSERLVSAGKSGGMIVVFTPHSSAASPARRIDAETRHREIAATRDAILGDSGIPAGSVRRHYRNFPVIHLDGNPRTVERLSADPRVAYIGENRRFSPTLSSSLPYIGAPTAHSGGNRGAGTAVALLDTGVDYTQSAFGSCTAPGNPTGCAVVAAVDTAPDDAVLDDDGHGTNVAGIVLGTAPDTKIVSIDVFNGPYAYDSDILEGLDWILTNGETFGIVAANLSLGDSAYHTSPCTMDPLAPAISALRQAGIVTVIASGNSAYAGGIFHPGISSPACVPAAVSVGAVYDSNVGSVNAGSCTDTSTQPGKPACFSQAASILSMTAPGVFVTAAGSSYSGTSQATPHVAGAVALLRGAHPAITADRVIDALVGGAQSITDKRFSPNLTFPRLDLNGALARFPKILVDPPSIDYGEVPTGGTAATEAITISNAGGVPLVLGTISLAGRDSDDFTIGSDSCSGTSLPSGGNCTMTIVHTPDSGGVRSASLVIPSDDPDRPELSVTLASRDIPLRTLTVSFAGEGSGSIVSSPAGITCPPTCSAPFPSGSVVTLSPLPAPSSLSGGWSDPACLAGYPCSIPMDTHREITVGFNLKPVSTASGTWYATLDEALMTVESGETVQMREGEVSGDLILVRDVQVAIRGGFDPLFTTQRSQTVVAGSLVVVSGSLDVDGIILR